MKKLLLLFFSFWSLAAMAQISTDEILQKKRERLEITKAMDLLFRKKFDTLIINKMARKQQPTLQLSGPGVYALPQDNMPCIIPDTNGVAPMPNAFRPADAAVAAIIPNAAKPVLPSK